MEATLFYTSQIQLLTELISQRKKRVQLFIFVRLSFFILTATLLYTFWQNNLIFSSLSVLGIVGFLLLVRFSVDAKIALELAEKKKEINVAELASLNNDFSYFGDGSQFVSGKHAFSLDLDLFGPNGLFRMLNRTTSQAGENQLAHDLLEGIESPEQRNEYLEILSTEIPWTHDFRTHASIKSRENGYGKSLHTWSKSLANEPSWLFWAILVIPILTIPSLILYNYDLITGMLFGGILALTSIPTFRSVKQTNSIAAHLSSIETRIQIVKEQVILIKALEHKNTVFKKLFKTFEQDNKDALKALIALQTIQKRFDLRMNIVVSIPLNIFAAWDLRQRHALNAWRLEYSSSLQAWETHLAHVEVLISGANVRFNYPESIFATFHPESTISVEKLLHPLLARKTGQANDLLLNDEEQFMILTGPNMAGKSTYLRSVGLLFVLANAGFPVFATNAKIPSVKLYTSMRTSDDLAAESSYFHAELTRLKFIISAIERGEKVFLLLDEILKGTNSKDKEEGSKKFLQKIKSLHSQGIIATHDLSLCELSQPHSGFVNFYFDSTISDASLYFDYTLRSGICQNMNASFLLKQMGLV
jgi:hypothetical protein